MHRPRFLASLALVGLSLAVPARPEPPEFKQGQEVLAQRPDGTWQQAIVDGKPDAAGHYPVQFMEEPYGHEVLPPERVRFDPKKGTLTEQLARAFPEIPKWTRVLVVKQKDGKPHWGHLTAQRGSILKIAWDDGSGRQRIAHKDILEQVPPDPAHVYALEAARDRAVRRLDRRYGHGPAEEFSIGHHVLALDRDDGQWYHARIREKSGDGYMVAWEDEVDPEQYLTGWDLRSP